MCTEIAFAGFDRDDRMRQKFLKLFSSVKADNILQKQVNLYPVGCRKKQDPFKWTPSVLSLSQERVFESVTEAKKAILGIKPRLAQEY